MENDLSLLLAFFCVRALPLFTVRHIYLISFTCTFKLNRAWFLNSPSSWLVTLLQKGSRWRYGAHGQRHYSKCGTRSILQRGISFPKPRVYVTCNGPVLNYISFVSCGYITLWIPFKFIISAATLTFPVYIYRSVSLPLQSPCTTLHLSLLNSLQVVHRGYG